MLCLRGGMQIFVNMFTENDSHFTFGNAKAKTFRLALHLRGGMQILVNTLLNTRSCWKLRLRHHLQRGGQDVPLGVNAHRQYDRVGRGSSGTFVKGNAVTLHLVSCVSGGIQIFVRTRDTMDDMMVITAVF